MSKFLKRGFCIIALLLLAGSVVGGLVAYKSELNKHADEMADLTYQNTGIDWGWQSKYERIQQATLPDGETIYRRVNRETGQEVQVRKSSLASFTVVAIFHTSCLPESQIDTGSTFSNGAPKLLYCDSDGSKILYFSKYDFEGQPKSSWSAPLASESFGGFSFVLNLRDIDFSQRDREITLSKAIIRE